MIGFWKKCAEMSMKIQFVVWFEEEGIYEIGILAKEAEFLAFSYPWCPDDSCLQLFLF